MKTSQFFEPKTSSPLTPYYSWEHRDMLNESLTMFKKRPKMIEKRKRIASGVPSFISLHFLCQFWCSSVFHHFPIFPEAQMHLKSCFWMPGTFPQHLEMIWDEIQKLHFHDFSSKIRKIDPKFPRFHIKFRVFKNGTQNSK